MRFPQYPARRRHDAKVGCLALLAAVLWPAAAAAQSALPQPEEPLPLEAASPGPSSPVSRDAAPKTEQLPDLTEVSRWSVPPVRWGGNALSNYNWNRAERNRAFNATDSVMLHASSYIYQPWFAQVAGDVGLLTGSSKQTTGNEGVPSTSSRNTSATYGGSLNLFPQSRFPFQAYLQTSDSRASANAVGQQYTSKRLGARQSYRPETGPDNYLASADRSIITSGGNRSIVDLVQGNFGTSVGDHGYAANARYSRTAGDIGGQGSSLLSVNGSHSWHSEDEFNVTSSAGYASNRISMLAGEGLLRNDSEIMQASSSVTWIPDPDLPLTVVGGGNLLHMNTETDTGRAGLSILSGYANARYQLTNNLAVAGGATVAQDSNNGMRRFASAQNATLSYSGNTLTFGEYSYNWGTGAGISNQIITGGASNRSFSGQVQHSLLRYIPLEDKGFVSLNASQALSVSSNSTLGQNTVLTHSAGASWRFGSETRTQGMLTASASDTLSTGSFASHFRSLSAQGNVQAQLSSRSAITALLNVVVSQQLGTPQLSTTQIPGSVPTPPSSNERTVNGSGQIAYTHRNPFDIWNLLYTASLQANASQANLRLVSGDPNATWLTGKVFQQNADYRMGRLLFRVTNSFATFNGKKNASLFVMIGREIGDF